jgi:hypothetical protein
MLFLLMVPNALLAAAVRLPDCLWQLNQQVGILLAVSYLFLSRLQVW